MGDRLVVLVCQCIFERDREKGVTKQGGMERVPEECVVGIAAQDGRKAGIRDVDEPKVRRVCLDRVHQAEDIHAENVNCFDLLLCGKEFVEAFVGRGAGRRREGDFAGRNRQKATRLAVADRRNNPVP